jgi:hypothetical protein
MGYVMLDAGDVRARSSNYRRGSGKLGLSNDQVEIFIKKALMDIGEQPANVHLYSLPRPETHRAFFLNWLKLLTI